jgi:hypothetical protein
LSVRDWLAIVGLLLLAGCGGGTSMQSSATGPTNTEPTTYKEDILAFLRTYLNDPTEVREAAISQPALKSVAGRTRYVACLRFNAKKSNGEYAGAKERLVVFLSGRLDTMNETARDQCKDALYEPFPELERLSR